MKSKVKLVLAALMIPFISYGGINVSYSIGYGLYDFGVTDLTSVDPADAFLSPGGSALFQLVFSASGTAAAVDLNGVGFVGGDNLVLQSYTITAGVGNYTGAFSVWGIPDANEAPFIDPTFTPGSVFMRVFQTSAPALGQYYFDSALLVLENRGSDPITDTQQLWLETGSAAFPSQGVALNLEIVPEPSVLAFLGLGGLALAVRRRLVA